MKNGKHMANGRIESLELRLTKLEADIRELKLVVARREEKGDWRSFVGIFADDPVYAEIRRTTMDLIEKERRRARRGGAKVKR